MYAMIEIRPDLAFAVKKLSQYCQNPSVRHRTALNRVLRYLKKTFDLQFIYDETIDSNFTCYADAAYGDDAIDRKSIYDNTLLIENDAVTWINKKQRTISSFTIEVEYVSLCQTTKNVVWATRWLNELKFNLVCNLPIRLLNDNQGSLDLIKNFENHSRTKHINVQYHYIREVAEDGLIKTSYVFINEMIADVLTKPTTPMIFKKLRKKLDLYWIFQKV